jgi:hypothetical protein
VQALALEKTPSIMAAMTAAVAALEYPAGEIIDILALCFHLEGGAARCAASGQWYRSGSKSAALERGSLREGFLLSNGNI